MTKKLRAVGIGAVLLLLAVELVLGWSSLAGALRQLRTPHLGWLALAVLVELAAMNSYGRMQRHVLRSAGVRAPMIEHLRLAYAAHSLSATLPGGPAFSTRFNYQQMRRFGASPAVASWAIALSGLLSTCALGVVTLGSALAAGGATHWQNLLGGLLAAVALLWGVRHLGRHPEVLRSPLAAVNRLRHRPETDGSDRIRGFVEQLRTARLTLGHGAFAAVLALANWLLDALCLWLCFRAVGEQPAALTVVLLAFCAAMAAGGVTIVPGGLGIIDSALILGLIAGGVPTSAAVAAVVLYRLISFGFIVALGWLSWLGMRSPRRLAPVPDAVPGPSSAFAPAPAPRSAPGSASTPSPVLTPSTAPALSSAAALSSAPGPAPALRSASGATPALGSVPAPRRAPGRTGSPAAAALALTPALALAAAFAPAAALAAVLDATPAAPVGAAGTPLPAEALS